MSTSYMMDELDDCSDQLRGVEYVLRDLARAAGTLGLTHLSKDLSVAHAQLNEVAERLRQVAGQVIADDFCKAQESSANILKACLAGVELAKRDEEDE